MIGALEDGLSYLSDRWNAMKTTFGDNWTKKIPEAWNTAWNGIFTMTMSPTFLGDDNRDSYSKGLKMWMDGSLGVGEGLLGGTVGSLFQAPGLNEVGVGLDKAYRYGVARPIAWGTSAGLRGYLAAAEAKQRGEDPNKAYLDYILSYDNLAPWGKHGMWSDEGGQITPGQSLMWNVGSAVGLVGERDDALDWAKTHDPRTAEGQANYSGEKSEFALKYGSGTVDLLLNFGADPSAAAAGVIKAGKLRYIDKVASEQYVLAGGVEKEITSAHYERFKQAAKDAPNPEALRWRTMPHATFGPQASVILWSAARMGDDVFRDAYVVSRGVDGLRDSNMAGAWDRLVDRAPNIASDFARTFANWNIGEDSLAIGRTKSQGHAVEGLVLNDIDAFVSAMANREGIWGTLPGKLMNEPQPKVSFIGDLRAGIHSYAMSIAPVHIGRRVQRKLVSAALPTQGHTTFLDAEDGTGIALRQFKANMERFGLPQDRVEWWVSNWAAKLSREGRTEVYERAEKEGIAAIAERLGVDSSIVAEAMPWLDRHRTGVRQLIQQQRVFISERAARLAALNVALGRSYESLSLRRLNRDLSARAKRGEFGDRYSIMPNVDGHPNAVPLPDTREMPDQAPDMNRPVLLSQTEQLIPTIDGRALEGQLRWYMRAHPQRKIFDSETRKWRLPLTIEELRAKYPANVDEAVLEKARKEEERSAVIRPLDRVLKPIGETRKFYDAAITGGDFVNMLWKSSALLRPAQTPRNLADDVLRRALFMGRLPVIMDAIRGPVRAIQNNLGSRGRLILRHEQISQALTSRRASRTTTAHVEAELDDDSIQFHVSAGGQGAGKAMIFPDLGTLLRAGVMGMDDFVGMLEWMNGSKGKAYQDVPLDLRNALNARDQGVDSVIVPVAQRKQITTKQAQQRQLKRRIIEYFWGADPTAFLDNLRVKGQDRRGTPVDPRYTAEDMRTNWLNELFNEHVYGRRGTRVRRLRAGNDIETASGVIQDTYKPAQMVVDPFTGQKPAKKFDSLQDFTIVQHRTLEVKSRTANGQPTGVPLWTEASQQMADFLTDHIDDLMKPNHWMSLSVMRDGNVRVGVARAKPSVVQAKGPTKPESIGLRIKNFKFKDIVDAGHTEWEIKLSNGDTITAPSAFGGPVGEAIQHRMSAQGGQGAVNYLTGETSYKRILDQMGGFGRVLPNEKGYAQSWERAVNAQIASDPVAVRFLMGDTDSSVLDWIESSKEGAKYIHRMHYFGVNYVDHIRQIEAMVNEYVPFDGTKAAQELRDAVLEKRATIDHLDRVVPGKMDQPEVHGASLSYTLGRGAVREMVANGIDRAQRLLSDLPTDKASRFPFFASAYKKHLEALVRVADSQFAKLDDNIPMDLFDNLVKQARERALHDTKYHLYDVAQVNDVARAARFVVPFSSAIMDSYLKYGRLVRENPGIVLQGLYYWQMFEREELVQDENGYLVRKGTDGAEHFYRKDPETGQMTEVPAEQAGSQRYVQFRLPSDLGNIVGKKYFGVDANPVFAVNKKSFNVFIDLPSSGPMVAFPVNEFALSNPEFGESEVIKKFVLPFGPSSDRGKVVIPSTVRSAWEAFQGQDGAKAEAQAKAIFQSEMIAYAREERDTPPSFAEARERAAMMTGLRFSAGPGALVAPGSTLVPEVGPQLAAAWLTPVSFQIKSPYQPFIDAYKQMVALDPENADEKFLAQYGDEFYAVAMTVTRNNAGLRATVESDKSFKAHSDLIAAYPDYAGLIVGADAGTFSKAVYEAQKEQSLRPGGDKKVREVLSLDDSVKDLEKRRVWTEYSKMMDHITADMVDKGITSLNDKRAAGLRKVRDAFIQQNMMWTDPASGHEVPSPWYDDYTQSDSAAMKKRVMAFWDIIQDPDLQNRDDIRGLAEYLTARERMQSAMQEKNLKTLSSKRAKTLLAKWNQVSFTIREKNPAFAQLWARWLSNDDILQV